MFRIVSRRVRVMAAVLGALIAWIQLFEPEPVRPTVLLPTLPAALTALAVEAGSHRAVYRAEKDRFVLAGPPEAVADEQRRAAAADTRAQGPGFSGLVGTKVPSLWRSSRLASLAVACLTALRGGRVMVLPEPGPEDRTVYGVDRGDVVVKLTAGTVFEVRIGAAVPGGNAHYFHCPQERIWGLLPGDVVARLTRLATRDLPEE